MKSIPFILLFSIMLLIAPQLTHPSGDPQDLLRQLNELELKAGQIAAEKELDCYKALAHRKYCKCLRDNSPAGLGFLEHIAVLTKEPTKVLLDVNDTEYKGLLNAAASAKNKCAEVLR